jgi:signal transduction histidine kinase
MIIIVLTLSLVMSVFGLAIKKYYYQGIANTFQNHVEAITPNWIDDTEFNYGSLKDYSDFIIKGYQYEGAELQLLTNEGTFVQSSSGFYEDKTYDIDEAVLSYKTIYEIERLTKTGEKVLAVYIPLLRDGQIVGVLLYLSSLTQVDDVMNHLLMYGLLICIIVAAIVFLVSLRLADSIVEPFNEIIKHTRELSKGKFKNRIKKTYPNELGEMSQTLNFLADEVVKNDRLRTDFISSISHELRTPLTGIKGWAEMIESSNGGLTKEEEKFGLQMIHSESERLMHLVEDLLDFSRYESNRMTINHVDIEFDTLIKDVALQLQKKAEEKDIQITIESTPVIINVDPDKIRQVLLNLLDNAIKFSPKGSTIQLSQYIKEDQVILKIEDHGIGIKSEQLDKIMDSFYKIDSKSIGAGLGLAIARNIVTKHNGNIQIKSKYGEGTIVYVYLPINEVNKNERE